MLIMGSQIDTSGDICNEKLKLKGSLVDPSGDTCNKTLSSQADNGLSCLYVGRYM